MKKFGIRMSGNEIPIEQTIIKYLSGNADSNFKYLEIGAAGTVSMNSIYQIVHENIKHDNWEIHGLDLPNGWSLDWDQITAFSQPLSIYINDQKNFGRIDDKAKAFLWLESDPREWISNLSNESLDICFIDGCHGAPCVRADFNVVASKIKRNGIVFFHDAGLPEQGTDWQGHCGEYINVRAAISELGLLETGNEWEFINETIGTRKIGGDGNSCIFIRKK